MSSRLRNFVHLAVKAVAAMSSLSWPSYGESADVATQVADLREPHPTVIVRGLDFSPDASRLSIQSDGEKINIWDWRHDHIETTLEKPRGAEGAVASNPIRYSPDGRLLAEAQALGSISGTGNGKNCCNTLPATLPTSPFPEMGSISRWVASIT